MIPADPALATALLLALGVALAAGISDLWTGRIPNLLTYPAIVVGLALWTVTEGWSGLALALAGALVLALPFLLGFLFGGSGGGDVKIMAALGALLSLGPGLVLLVHALAVGALMAIAVLILHGRIGDFVRRMVLTVLYLPLGPRKALGLMLVDGPSSGRGEGGHTAAARKAPGVRFGIAAALGLVWMLMPEGWRLPVAMPGW